MCGGEVRLPVVFVHGNGDSAALWQTTLWRFESNGWARERLHAIDFPYPLARDDDALPQAGRSATGEQMRFLAAEVERVLERSGAGEVILIGNSRGGYAIRNYVRNGPAAGRIAAVVLGGVPNHGIWAGAFMPGNEFNGQGPFLRALNAPQGPRSLEITPGPRWMTLRSDHNDKYAQPDARWIGAPETATGVGFDGPALEGACNVVLAGLDHRELSFHARAFERTWRFLTGRRPAHAGIVAESAPVLDGRISPPETNLPMAGVTVQVFEVSAATGERLGAAVHCRTTAADGRWGPMAARPDTPCEFVVSAPGYAIMHLYRSAFPRSCALVHMRPVTLEAADRGGGSVVMLSRPRGYFDLRRDHASLDGAPLPDIPPGPATVSMAKLALPAGPARTVVAQFNGERIAVRTWPAGDNHVVFAELHY